MKISFADLTNFRSFPEVKNYFSELYPTSTIELYQAKCPNIPEVLSGNDLKNRNPQIII